MGKKKFIGQTDMKIGVIGDEETVTGFVLAGAGHVDGQGKKNFMIVGDQTNAAETAAFFDELTERTDLAMILITVTAAETIQQTLENYAAGGKIVPTILQIPSKEKPYDPKKDSVMQ